MSLYQKPARPRTIKLSELHDKVAGMVEKYDAGLEVWIQTAGGELLPIEQIYMQELGGLKIVIVERKTK